MFRELLSIRGADYAQDFNRGFPFCNELDHPGGVTGSDVPAACPPMTLGGEATGAPGLPPRPFFELYQDEGPIRPPALHQRQRTSSTH